MLWRAPSPRPPKKGSFPLVAPPDPSLIPLPLSLSLSLPLTHPHGTCWRGKRVGIILRGRRRALLLLCFAGHHSRRGRGAYGKTEREREREKGFSPDSIMARWYTTKERQPRRWETLIMEMSPRVGLESNLKRGCRAPRAQQEAHRGEQKRQEQKATLLLICTRFALSSPHSFLPS